MSRSLQTPRVCLSWHGRAHKAQPPAGLRSDALLHRSCGSGAGTGCREGNGAAGRGTGLQAWPGHGHSQQVCRGRCPCPHTYIPAADEDHWGLGDSVSDPKAGPSPRTRGSSGAGSCHYGWLAGTPEMSLTHAAPQFPTFPPARHPSYFAFLPLSYLPAGSPLCSWSLVFSLPSPSLPGPTCRSSPLKDPEAGP